MHGMRYCTKLLGSLSSEILGQCKIYPYNHGDNVNEFLSYLQDKPSLDQFSAWLSHQQQQIDGNNNGDNQSSSGDPRLDCLNEPCRLLRHFVYRCCSNLSKADKARNSAVHTNLPKALLMLAMLMALSILVVMLSRPLFWTSPRKQIKSNHVLSKRHLRKQTSQEAKYYWKSSTT